MKKILFVILVNLIILSSCATSSYTKTDNSMQKSSLNKIENLYKGKGLVIAVTLPQTRNVGQSLMWIPQYFQDSLTGNFSFYSEMTVLDRSNENLIKAEQELSETGFYTDENAVQLGQMTNAALVVVGSIQQISGMYEVNFRINDITTNEIKSSFNKRYSYLEIENGKAVNEITQELFEGLGIELSETEKITLSKINQTENSSVQNLAKGMVAEKQNDYINALVAYNSTDGNARGEAEKNIHNLLNGSMDSSNIQNRIAFYKEQTDKWNNIFFQLEKYMNDNVAYLVYDFSNIQDSINMKWNTVNFVVFPGIKCFFNRTAMNVYATVINEWKSILEDHENDVWTKAVKAPCFGDYTRYRSWHSVYNLNYTYNVSIVLINGDGDIVKKENLKIELAERVFNADRHIISDIIVKSQKKYFETAESHQIYFNDVNFDDVTGNMSIKIISATCEVFEYMGQGLSSQEKKLNKKPLKILSIEEWRNITEN